jgi:CHAT domain-containing protein
MTGSGVPSLVEFTVAFPKGASMFVRAKGVGVSVVLSLVGLVLTAGAVGAAGDPNAAIENALQEGQPARARALALKRANEAHDADNRLAEVGTLADLGNLFRSWGYYEDARLYLQRMLQVCEGFNPPEHLGLAKCELNVALLYQDAENFIEAGRHYERCRRQLELAETAPSTVLQNQPGAEAGLRRFLNYLLPNNLGKRYEKTGQYAEGEREFTRAAERLGQSPANLRAVDQLRYAEAINNRGWLRFTWARSLQNPTGGADALPGANRTPQALFQDAFADIQAAKDIRERLRARQDVSREANEKFAQSLNNLALAFYAQGQLGEAEQELRQSLRMYKEVFGGKHPEVGRVEHNLAAVLRSEGQFREARQLHLASLTILEANEGPQHPDVGAAHAWLAWLQAAAGQPDWPGAALEMDKARHIFRQHIGRVLSSQSEAAQLAFLETKDRPQFHAALTLGVRAAAERAALQAAGQKVVDEAAEWLLNGKGVTPEVLAERIVRARQSTDANAQALNRQLSQVRDEMAAHSVRRPAGEAGREDTLARQEADLSTKLALQLGHPPAEPWVDLLEVRRVLASDRALAGKAVLIDIARFELIDFRSGGTDFVGREEHYAAWVIPPDGEGQVRVFDLGPAERIDQAVKALRDDIESQYKKSTRRLDRAAELRFQQRSRAVADLVLKNLYPYVGEYERWLVSPDSNLWLVPWAALVLPGDGGEATYAVEKHAISLVSSGRDLVTIGRALAALRARGLRRGAPLILADPDLGEAPRGKRALFEPLDAASVEAGLIAPSLGTYTGTANLEPLYGKDATTAAFLRAERPMALVLCTHGFFFDKGKDLANPLLRCGVALAGANASDDGLLLGVKVLQTDLRGTDLVVLSACETALGKVREGEGVANLQAAFRLAGAQTVLGTLWEVPDLDTAQLTSTFFERLATRKVQDKAEVLREAQVDLIKKLRSQPQRSAHPFRWAALTMTGQWAITLDAPKGNGRQAP